MTQEVPRCDLDRCLAFYALIGFRPVPAPPGVEGRAIWLERSGTQLHLVPIEDDARQRKPPAAAHVGVIVERYEATVRRLRSEGYDVRARREHWGSPRSYVRDPAGHLVELIAFAPGDRASKDG